MGHVYADVRLCNPRDTTRCLEMRLLVDTGSTYTWVKREKLAMLGIEPMARCRFRTIDGKIVEREIGEVLIECLGERATTIVVFAEDEDNEVLGVYTLEGLRLEVDPTARQLRKVEALLAL